VEAKWIPAKHSILGDDPQSRLFGEVSEWYKKIELFRKGEDDRMFLHDPTAEDMAVHKSLLQRLVTDGEHFLSLIKQIGLPEEGEDMTLESVAATVGLLRADYRGWHEPMPIDKQQRILRDVFPDVA
jgi:hypothetical protein